MRREEIIGIVADLYEENNISEFGFSLKKICLSMDINLLPYSSYENHQLLVKFDRDGFNWYNPLNRKFEIFYNDEIKPFQRVKFTILHELGHICLGHTLKMSDETFQQKHEADLFANEFYCPQAFIIHYNLLSVSDLISTFGITEGYAIILLEKIKKRKNLNLSKNELRLIEIFEKNKMQTKKHLLLA